MKLCPYNTKRNNELRTQLEKYKTDNIRPENLALLLTAMLENLGCPDGYLRDELIYEAFCTMLELDHISGEQVKQIAFTLIDSEYLYYHIHQENDTAVIKRSFSVLFLASIFIWEQEKDLFSPAEYEKLVTAILSYFSQESDFRGYVPEYGWLHAIAHGSDALAEIVKNHRTTQQTAEQILHLINDKVCQGDYVFIDREYFRMCQIPLAFLHKEHYNQEKIITFINNLQNPYENAGSAEYYHARNNIELFLFQFYFELKKQGGHTDLMDTIYKKIQENG